MKKIKTIAGVTWAVAGLLLIIILFPGLPGFSNALSKMSFMKIHPVYSGGEIAYSDSAAGLITDVRKPVFRGLLHNRDHGFVQVDWRGKIPEILTDTIDYDSDGERDFVIIINKGIPATDLKILSNKVTGLNTSTPTSYGWAARIDLKK